MHATVIYVVADLYIVASAPLYGPTVEVEVISLVEGDRSRSNNGSTSVMTTIIGRVLIDSAPSSVTEAGKVLLIRAVEFCEVGREGLTLDK